MTKVKLVPMGLTENVAAAIKQCHIDYCCEVHEWRARDYENLYDDIVSSAPNGGKVSLSVYLDFANELSLSMDCGADLADRPGNRSDAKRLSRLGKWDINHETYEDVMVTARKLIQRLGLEVGVNDV